MIILFLILITLTGQASDERYIAGYDTRTFPTPSETTVTTISTSVGGAILALPWADANVADNITVNWIGLDTYPDACGAGDFVTTVGDTLTCDTPSYTTDTDTNTQTACDNNTVSTGGGDCIEISSFYIQGTGIADSTIDTNQTAFESIQVDLNLMYCQMPDTNNTSRLSYSVIANPPTILPDSTIDLNTTASDSWLAKAHTFTAIQTIQSDLNITESGTDNGISFEPDLNRIWIGAMFMDYNGTGIMIGG